MCHSLRYVGGDDSMLNDFVDFYRPGDAGGKKSDLGFSFSLHSCMISWLNRK